MEPAPPVASVTHYQLKTPRAAALAGIVFSVLLSATLVLLRLSVQFSPRHGYIPADTWATRLALHLVPFSGIAFLWFIGVVRDRLGAHEDRFFSTVFLGSGLLFLAMLFVAAAVAGAVVMSPSAAQGLWAASEAVLFGRAVSAQIMNVFALKMAGVFMISTATLAMRTATLPLWITLPGYGLAGLLLASARFVDWLPLAFPLWVLVMSVYILAENLRGKPGEAK